MTAKRCSRRFPSSCALRSCATSTPGSSDGCRCCRRWRTTTCLCRTCACGCRPTRARASHLCFNAVRAIPGPGNVTAFWAAARPCTACRSCQVIRTYIPRSSTKHTSALASACAGEVGGDVFILVRGDLHVLDTDQETFLLKIPEGTVFGETTVLRHMDVSQRT